MEPNKIIRKKRIKLGIRKKIKGTASRPRISIFKSNKAVYAQIIDDAKGHTLISASSKEITEKTVNIEYSKKMGLKLAEKAKEAGITEVVFDRSGYLYHGNLKAIAEGAREGGLKF